MKRTTLLLLTAMSISGAWATEGNIKGKILDKNSNTPLEFVNIKITSQSDSAKIAGGAISDIDGKFNIGKLPNGQYTITLTCIGYRDVTRRFTISDKNQNISYPALYMTEDAKMLKEVTITGQQSTMKLEVDRKTFDVGSLVSNAGQAATDVLENIPSVEVDNDGNVSLRGNSSVEIWINGKASGLTTDNRAQILEQLPAESIEHVEVIDNPSAKFSAEGSAGIINIVLKKNRKAGYYGSVQAGADTRGGANTSFNINYNSSKLDAFASVGYRHRENVGKTDSEQEYFNTHQYQTYHGTSPNLGNNIFTRAGLTWHLTDKDDMGITGMLMTGKMNNWQFLPYHYGVIGADMDTRMMYRRSHTNGRMLMQHVEYNYRHNFTERHFLDFTASYNRWKMNMDNLYQDSTTYYGDDAKASEYAYQSRPMKMNNRNWDFKLDYENPITDAFMLQAGYQATLSHENSPQESWIDDTWDGVNKTEDKLYYNRFIYDMDLHAGYLTLSYKFGKFSLMGGLRGEYWKVNTESYTWDQEHDATKRDPAFKKDFFKLFPSVFMSYQLTPNDQLQLNYTRRLRRPWGGQLNSFKDTRDATMISFGNPELTPEYSNSFSLNYLRTWTQHSLLISAYYRPTTDVMQRISWQNSADNIMYSTTKNIAKSQSSGLEMTLKNKFGKNFDLTTNVNGYYYKLDGFSYNIDGQTITGEERDNFQWNARMTGSLILPYDISLQLSGRYNSRQTTVQGYRKANYSVDLGVRKNFFNKKLSLSISCRDLLDTRKWQTYTETDTFTRYQLNRRGGRKVNFTLTWNFGNNNSKKKGKPDGQNMQDDDTDMTGGYSGGGDM